MARQCTETSSQCYGDSKDNRVLSARLVQHSGSMSRAACLALCDGANYEYAGVEYGEQCFCGHAVATGAQKAAASECSMACDGNASETCGASWNMDVMTFTCAGPKPPPSPAPPPAPKGAKNVVFMACDDLRPELGAYNGTWKMSTPNLDKLAAGGLLFERAYVQYAVCSPSRNSFMSGRRPDTNKVWNFKEHRLFEHGTSAPALLSHRPVRR